MTGAAALLGWALTVGDLLHGPGPSAVHYRARYRTADGTWHALEVWRQGETRLRRRTDDKLEIHASRTDASAAPQLVVLDLPRRAAYTAEPTELLQAGLLTDWTELAHSLARPRPGQRLVALKRSERTALGRCRVYRLEQAAAAPTFVCWSASWQLPLIIRSARGDEQFVLERADTGPIAPGVFEIPADLVAQLRGKDD